MRRYEGQCRPRFCWRRQRRLHVRPVTPADLAAVSSIEERDDTRNIERDVVRLRGSERVVFEIDARIVGGARFDVAPVSLPDVDECVWTVNPILLETGRAASERVVGLDMFVAADVDDEEATEFVSAITRRLVRERGLAGAVAAVPVDIDTDRLKDVSLRFYVQQVVAGAIRDPALSPHLDADLRPRLVSHSPDGRRGTVVLTWDNPARRA